MEVSGTWHVSLWHTNLYLHAASVSKRPAHRWFCADVASIFQTEDAFPFRIDCWAFDSRADSVRQRPVSFAFIHWQVCLCWYYSGCSAICDGWWGVEKILQVTRLEAAMPVHVNGFAGIKSWSLCLSWNNVKLILSSFGMWKWGKQRSDFPCSFWAVCL